MITLEEVFDVSWTITSAEITARDEHTRLLHRFIFADAYNVSISQWHDIEAGRLTIVLGKINVHGDEARGGAEIGWGYKKKSIPTELMEAPITHMQMGSRYRGKGTQVYIDVECSRMTAEILKQSLADKALKWEEDSPYD